MRQPPDEDYQLLQQYVKEGSHEAFAELVKRHLDMVYSTAYSAAAMTAVVMRRRWPIGHEAAGCV